MLKTLKTFRYIIIVLMCFWGMICCYNNFIVGCLFIMSGLLLLPKLFGFIKFKFIKIILALFFLLLALIVGSFNDYKSNESDIEHGQNYLSKESDIANDQPMLLKELIFDNCSVELNINDTKEIKLKINPENADIGHIQCRTSDEKISFLEQINFEKFKITAVSKGECEIWVESDNAEIKSNRIFVKILENELETQQGDFIKNKQSNEPIKTLDSSENSKSNSTISKSKSSSTSKNSNNTHGKSVYRTPKGKRYHYDPDCGGKNSYKTTLVEAKNAGLTPCQKCVY